MTFRFLLYGVFILFPFFAFAEVSPIIIQEVQIRGESENDEFIELKNLSTKTVSIESWQLRRKTASGSESSIKVFDKGTAIKPLGTYLWANSKGIFAPLADTMTSSSALADNNSIALYTKSGATGVLIDSVSWGTGALFDTTLVPLLSPPKGQSLFQKSIGLWEVASPSTPESSSSVTVESPDEEPPAEIPTPSLSFVRISEFLANPKPDQEEFIELVNTGDTEVDIHNWSLRDASKTGKYVFPPKTIMKSGSYLVIPKSLFKFALNNSNETLSLLDASGNIVQTLTYKKSIPGVTHNILDDMSLRGGAPTPGSKNIVNELPKTRERVPKKGFVNFKIPFDARGKDSETKKLKYTWDFGDGHKSYQEKPTHTYDKKGVYTVTLMTKDGQDELTETFTLKVRKYTPPKIHITRFMPNPEGKDTEGEWLELENKSDESVTLENWSVATGSKKKNLTNHPIRTKVVIEAGSILRLTREDVLFNFPNKKGFIELRAPNKKVVDDVRYKVDASIAEGVIYSEETGNWIPSSPSSEDSETTDDASSDEQTSSLVLEEDVPVLVARTEEEKKIVYQNLKNLVTPPGLEESPVLAMEPSATLESLYSPKKKDSFESFKEKLNASLVSFLN